MRDCCCELVAQDIEPWVAIVLILAIPVSIVLAVGILIRGLDRD